MKYNSVESLESFLSVIKTMEKDNLDEQYYELMTSAKELLGDMNPQMAKYYYQYGSYLLTQIQNERNNNLFGQINQNIQNKQKQEQQSLSDQQQQIQGADANTNNKVQFKNEDVTIINGDDNGMDQQQKQQENIEKIPENEQKNQQVQNQDEICYENLSTSLNIYLNELQLQQKGEKQFTKQQFQNLLINIAKVHSRLADFYYVNQNFDEAITQFKQALRIRNKFPDAQTSRLVASIYFMLGNCYIVKNDDQCEVSAIAQYIEGVKVLVAHMSLHSDYKNYELPTKNKLKVDRIHYLPKFSDSDYVKDLKELINNFLDKIEDTQYQLQQKQQVARLKEKQQKKKREQQQKFAFKQPQPNVPIINLGTFGNANTLIKRKIPPIEISNEQNNTNKKIKKDQQSNNKQQ